MKRWEVLWAMAGTLVLAVAIVRLAVPDRSRLRPLSVEAIHVPSEPIKNGQSMERSFQWLAPEDVYIVGWAPHVSARNSGAEMALITPGPPPMVLFEYVENGRVTRDENVPAGTGFVVRKGTTVTLRYRLNNSGPDSQTLGGVAFIYFVSVAGN